LETKIAIYWFYLVKNIQALLKGIKRHSKKKCYLIIQLSATLEKKECVLGEKGMFILGVLARKNYKTNTPFSPI
jgi:hypothetical protein